MSSITTSPLARTLVTNPVVWSLTVLAVLAAAIASASTPLLLVCGVLAFGRPLLYAGLLKLEDEARHAGAPRLGQRLPFEHRVGAQGVF